MHVRWLVLLCLVLGFVARAHAEDEAPPAAPKQDEARAKARAELDELVVELRAEAERIRGLPWKSEVPGHTILRKEIPPAFEEEVAFYFPPEKRGRYARALRRMGFLAEDEDPFTIMGSMMAGMAGGFYSPRARELFVVEGFAGDGAKPILLHELVHALEDQHFDYRALTLPITMDPDRSFAASCVVEGSAEHARVAYQNAHPEIMAAFARSSADPEAAKEQMRVLRTTPAFMIVPTLLHYRHGPLLVTRALRQAEGKGYKDVMAELYADPPESTEQILHPDRWFTDKRDYPRGILWAGDLSTALGPGWEAIYEQRFGELDLALYLDRYLGGTNGRVDVRNLMRSVPTCDQARKAAEGWDGGRMLFLANGDAPLVMVQAWAFDTPDDASEAGAALAEALKRQHGDAWKAGTWEATAPAIGQAFETRTLSYTGLYGRGRIAIRPDRVLVLDGAPDDAFETAWRWVLQTRILKDDRDTWTAK